MSEAEATPVVESGTPPVAGGVEKELAALRVELDELKKASPKDALCIGVMNQELDHVLAAFVIALGAAAYDTEVNMFFTFWATSALRDPKKAAKKTFIEKMFGWMMPRGSKRLPLSHMNMGGAGSLMIRSIMKQKGVKSLEEMLKDAGELGVKIYICEMSMDLMGFKPEEMIDYPNLEYVGVGTFISLMQDAKQAFFL